MVQAGDPSEMRVGHWFHQAVAGERFLVGVCGPQATVTVGDLTGDACFHCIPWRVLLAELASNSLTRHGRAGPISPLPAALTWGIGPTDGSLLEAIDDVLQSHIPLEAIQAPVVQRDNIPARRTLESSNGFNGFTRAAARDQDAVGTAEAEAVGTGEQQGVLEQLQADWTGQFGLQCFHL